MALVFYLVIILMCNIVFYKRINFNELAELFNWNDIIMDGSITCNWSERFKWLI